MSSRSVRALIAFAFHAPGLWLLCGTAIAGRTARLNLWALGATLLAMLLGGAGWGGQGAFFAWLAGHFTWSFTLASRVLRGVER